MKKEIIMEQPQYDGTTTPKGELARKADINSDLYFYEVAFDDKPNAKRYPVKSFLDIEIPKARDYKPRVLLPSTSGSFRVRTALLLGRLNPSEIAYSDVSYVDWVIGVVPEENLERYQNELELERKRALELTHGRSDENQNN